MWYCVYANPVTRHYPRSKETTSIDVPAINNIIRVCSIDEARAAIVELAKLHRQYWNETLLSDLDWIRLKMPSPQNALDLLEDQLRTLLTEAQHDVVKQAAPRIHDWLGLEPDNQTLNHVDYRSEAVARRQLHTRR